MTNFFKQFKNLDFFKKVIAEKKRLYFETKLTKNTGKPKELWKTLKSLELRNKVSIATINALKDDKVVKYDPKPISEVFKTIFVITEKLLEKLLCALNKYGIDSVSKFY